MKRLIKVLSEKVTEFRKLKGLTQEQLAERTDLSQSIIQKIESGKIWPRIETIEVLATVLGVPQISLLYETDTAPEVKIVRSKPSETEEKFKSLISDFEGLDSSTATLIQKLIAEFNRIGKSNIDNKELEQIAALKLEKEKLKSECEVMQIMIDDLKAQIDKPSVSLDKKRQALVNAIAFIDDNQLGAVAYSLRAFTAKSRTRKERMEKKVVHSPLEPIKVVRGKSSKR